MGMLSSLNAQLSQSADVSRVLQSPPHAGPLSPSQFMRTPVSSLSSKSCASDLPHSALCSCTFAIVQYALQPVLLQRLPSIWWGYDWYPSSWTSPETCLVVPTILTPTRRCCWMSAASPTCFKSDEIDTKALYCLIPSQGDAAKQTHRSTEQSRPRHAMQVRLPCDPTRAELRPRIQNQCLMKCLLTKPPFSHGRNHQDDYTAVEAHALYGAWCRWPMRPERINSRSQMPPPLLGWGQHHRGTPLLAEELGREQKAALVHAQEQLQQNMQRGRHSAWPPSTLHPPPHAPAGFQVPPLPPPPIPSPQAPFSHRNVPAKCCLLMICESIQVSAAPYPTAALRAYFELASQQKPSWYCLSIYPCYVVHYDCPSLLYTALAWAEPVFSPGYQHFSSPRH